MVGERLPGLRVTPSARRAPAGAHRATPHEVAASETLAFEAFVAERGESLLRLAYLVTGNHADAEDLLQDTLADVHRKWSRVAASAHPYAYVRAMMQNKYVSSRRRKWHGERPTDPADVVDLHGESVDPTRAVDGADAMWRLLATLPPRMRSILVLRYFEELDDAEIAGILGIRVSTVRATASRALRQLREGGMAP